jgi:hypothetical protein
VNKEALMSPRLLYLLSTESAPPYERDRTDSLIAAARIPAGREPRWVRTALMLV